MEIRFNNGLCTNYIISLSRIWKIMLYLRDGVNSTGY
jgi:hypothetical protein